MPRRWRASASRDACRGRFQSLPCSAPPRRVSLVGGRPADCLDDVVVARAAAEVAGDSVADLVLGHLRRVWMLVDEPAPGDHHSGCAEPAVPAVLLLEPYLDRFQ